MVRLWGPGLGAGSDQKLISIPLWFDYGFNRFCPVSLTHGFQFHYGSIMGKGSNPHKEGNPKFQFHYGSIMGIDNRTELTDLEDFNSTMVRLWGFFSPDFGSLDIKFQFHYGSIMGPQGIYRPTTPLPFQFHYGSIMGLALLGLVNVILISIPLWFDYG